MFCSSQLCNCRQMDLSGPGIDVKLKERKKERTRSFFNAGIHPLPKYPEPSVVLRSLFTRKRRFIKITAPPPPCTLPTYNSLETTYLLIYLPTYPQLGHYLPTHQPHRSFSSICFVVCFLLARPSRVGGVAL